MPRHYKILQSVISLILLISSIGCIDLSKEKVQELENKISGLEKTLEKDRQSTANVYKAYKTKNMWTFLLLNTQTGQIWQCHYSINDKAYRGKIPINFEVLDANGKPGQFELESTDNIWNYILVNKANGNMYQVQFSMEDAQMIVPMQ